MTYKPPIYKLSTKTKIEMISVLVIDVAVIILMLDALLFFPKPQNANLVWILDLICIGLLIMYTYYLTRWIKSIIRILKENTSEIIVDEQEKRFFIKTKKRSYSEIKFDDIESASVNKYAYTPPLRNFKYQYLTEISIKTKNGKLYNLSVSSTKGFPLTHHAEEIDD